LSGVESLLLYLAVGAFAGFVAGLLGVGGGLIIVPALVFGFRAHGLAEANIVHLAIGTSLATIVATSASSMWAHHRHGAVRWPVFRRLTSGLVAGALLGAAIADLMPSQKLRIFFGVFELLVAVQMALQLQAAPYRELPGVVGMSATGTVIGGLSAVVGIGGGTLTVPFLTWCNVSIRQAVATSSACGFPIAIAGALGYVIAGWNEADQPALSSGYVYWPAFGGIVAASMLLAPFGAKMAHRLPTVILRRVFAGFLALLGIRMLIG